MMIRCTACGYESTPEAAVHPCPKCGEPVEVAYAPGEIDPAAALAGQGRTRRRDGGDTGAPGGALEGILGDMAAVLPPFIPAERVSLGEGGTPLIPLTRLGRKLGLPNLYLKNEGTNPTGSFKDRGTAVALSWAVRVGARRVGTVSSGNMASSVAAYAARAGLPCDVLVPAHLRPEKIFAIAITQPRLTRVEGDYGLLYERALALGKELGIYFAVSDDPFRVEGQKTTAYEIVRDLRQLGIEWEQTARLAAGLTAGPIANPTAASAGRRGDTGAPPLFIFNATSAGGHTSGLLKAFEEMVTHQAVAGYPEVVAVQAAGCAPIAGAFRRGEAKVTRLDHAETDAHAIANPSPPSGSRVLRTLARLGHGGATAVTDEEMKRAQRLISAEEGLFIQFESAGSLAAALQYRDAGMMGADSVVVLIGTGNGLKDPGAFSPNDFKVDFCHLEQLDEHLATEPR